MVPIRLGKSPHYSKSWRADLSQHLGTKCWGQTTGEGLMIVDFQHHFTPRELIKDDPGDRLVLHYDENGAPSYTVHSLLYDLDEHIRMMDLRSEERRVGKE